MASNLQLPPFNPEVESITEFIERFTVQQSEALSAAGDDGIKKASLLVKSLPVDIVTGLQRRLKPVKLSAAKYDELVSKLTSQYEV